MEKFYVGEIESPLHRLRAGRVLRVFDEASEGTPDAGKKGGTGTRYGRVKLRWLDATAEHNGDIEVSTTWVSWLFGSGIFYMPNVGDILICDYRGGNYPVVVGSLPFNYDQMVSNLDENDLVRVPFGHVRKLVSGEYLIKSNKQAEIYLDRAGNVRLLTKGQDVTNTFKAQGLNENAYTRVRDENNTQVEFTLGAAVTGAKNADKSLVKETLGGKEIRAQLKVRKPNVQEFTRGFEPGGTPKTVPLDSATVAIRRIEGFHKNQARKFRQGIDYELSGTDLIWRNKAIPASGIGPDPSSSYTVYTYTQPFKLDVDSDGQSFVTAAAHTLTVNGATLTVDTSGNVSVNTSGNVSVTSPVINVQGVDTDNPSAITINSGTKGAARLDDSVIADGTTDTISVGDNVAFFTYLSALMQVFTTWTPVAGDGGASLKTLLTAFFSTNPAVPTSITGKINEASGTTKIGD
jgi:hypothetical protein